MSYVLVVTWKPHQVISTVDTSSKQVSMQTPVSVDSKLAGRRQTQQLSHSRKPRMHVEEDNHPSEGNNNLLFDEIRDEPGVKAANATIDKHLQDQPAHPGLYRPA
jgi:hypothetical protein